MADLGTLITIADKVFELLKSPVLKDMKDWESILGKLNTSVSFIKDMLLDAEAKPELSRVEQRWVDELNEVLYEADDLFDEVITIAKMKELDGGAKFSKKVIDKSLIMIRCESLKEWPKYFSKLVNLKLLDISGPRLICMPLHMDQLINLRDLSHFRVDGGQLKDLKFLVNLRGELDIRICVNLVSEKENEWEDSYLEPMKNLKKVHISVFNEASNDAAIIAKLQPNRNLMELWLRGYEGTEIPRWGRAQDDWSSILPNLVRIDLDFCERLHGLPVLSNLKHLKELFLWELNNLEYMETGAISHCSSGSKDIQFFPSLEYLSLVSLKRLKGWWGRVGEGDSSSGMLHWQPPFPRLSTLIINSCPKLTSLPPCPSLEELKVCFIPGEGPGNLDLKLRVEETDVAFKNSSSLLRLVIEECVTLKSVSGVLEHLTALKSLSLKNFAAQVDYADMPWSSLHNLCSLKLTSLESLEILPTGIKHLTALQNLSIYCCDSLKGLPEWISCLQSLHSLTIYRCPELNSLGTIQYITSLQKLDITYCPHLTEDVVNHLARSGQKSNTSLISPSTTEMNK